MLCFQLISLTNETMLFRNEIEYSSKREKLLGAVEISVLFIVWINYHEIFK